MEFKEIKVNSIYEVWGDEHKVVYKHEGSKTVFTLEVGSDNPYAWEREELHIFSPITLPETGLLVSEAGSIVYRTGEWSGYGFTPPGFISPRDWYHDYGWGKFIPEIWRKATPEDEKEFRELFIKEAAKHGLVDGVEFESPFSGVKCVVNTKDTRFIYEGFLMGVGYVFYKGKWATPIKNEKQDELDSTIEKLSKLKDKVYEFWYNDCIYEGAAACISLHRTKKGAEMALAFHKEQKRREHEELYKEEEADYDYGYMCAWGITEREIVE